MPELDLRAARSPKVSYHFNEQVVQFHFGERHPMKPFRLLLTQNLVLHYGMHNHMDVYRPRAATKEEVCSFHRSDYVEFLERVTPTTISSFSKEFADFNMGIDCPIFDGLFQHASLCAGASLDAARKLISHQSEIAINWSGGLHHAKKQEASGFCFFNDIVLAILSLLRVHARVLYIDIDVHHGDGVQEAFYLSERVMTLSFHKWDGQYFPGTGTLQERGAGRGANFTLNVPLKDGIDDGSYTRLFKSVLQQVLVKFRPGAIVLQCGADSLGGDRLGRFNLSIKAHAECVRYAKSFGLPLLVLGGGGYTPRNVSRAWAYETAVCLDMEPDQVLAEDMPLREHYGPEGTLFPNLSGGIVNDNSSAYLNSVFASVMEQLRYIISAPSVQMHVIPPDIEGLTAEGDAQVRDAKEEASTDIRTAAEAK